ncbi:bromodomain protein, putative [Plasmodium ovale curtisi]|uniref:Bromodomain protein, putative n=1 Tax=Plasmodium ovale curtisi TaxID=864141 RepID=A0A1A8X401_PLAOA|nr:bromodomain protein, putative [Plasmodium ovale curtisi]
MSEINSVNIQREHHVGEKERSSFRKDDEETKGRKEPFLGYNIWNGEKKLMNKSGQNFQKKESCTGRINQEYLLLDILNRDKKYTVREEKCNSDDMINEELSYVAFENKSKEECENKLKNEKEIIKTYYELYNITKYKNINKYYKTNNLINFYNDKHILTNLKRKRKIKKEGKEGEKEGEKKGEKEGEKKKKK